MKFIITLFEIVKVALSDGLVFSQKLEYTVWSCGKKGCRKEGQDKELLTPDPFREQIIHRASQTAVQVSRVAVPLPKQPVHFQITCLLFCLFFESRSIMPLPSAFSLIVVKQKPQSVSKNKPGTVSCSGSVAWECVLAPHTPHN